MEMELYPTVSFLPETNSRLLSPVEAMAGAINCHPESYRHRVLFICGNHSRILSRLDRNVTETADRVFCICSEPAKVREKPEARMPEAQSMAEART